MKNPINQEEREALALLADSEGWEALVKLLDVLVQDRKHRVLTYPLTKGPEGLVHEKARAEGAESLQAAILTEVERIAKAERSQE